MAADTVVITMMVLAKPLSAAMQTICQR